MAYDPVSTAMSGLSGSIERFGGMIGKSVSDKAGRQLEELKLARGLEAEKQQSQLRGMNIESLGMKLDEQKAEAKSDAEDFLIAPIIQHDVDKIVPLPEYGGYGAPGVGDAPRGGMQVSQLDPDVNYEKKIKGRLTIKAWIAKQLPTIISSVVPGVELKHEGENLVLYSKTFGRNLTNGDIRRIPDFKEKMGTAMAGLMSRERILKVSADVGDPKSIQRLAEYEIPGVRLKKLQEELAFRQTLVTITGNKGWDKTAVLKGVKDIQDDIDKEEAKLEEPWKAKSRQAQIDFAKEKAMATKGKRRETMESHDKEKQIAFARDKATTTATATASKPPTPYAAQKRISTIIASIARFDKTDKADSILAALIPGYTAGTKVNSEEKKRMMKQFEKEIKNLEKLIPKRSELRRGKLDGKTVIEYDNGDIEYGD